VSAPSVSVVVPTKDRPRQLRECLQALGRLDYPRERLEVIVVDDGGTFDLGHVGEAVLLRHQHSLGPGAARNTGAQAAEGDMLAFTDDDCLPERDWLRELMAAVASGSAAGGRTVNALTANPYARASQHIQDLVYAHFNARPEAARFLASNNLALARDAFLELGGFDADRFPEASEDRDLCDRWLASGRTLRYAPGAVVHHAHELDLAGFVRQHVAYGRGAARYQRARAARGTGRLRDDASFHLNAALWRQTMALRPARRAAGMAVLLGIWQAANLLGYVSEGRSSLKRAPRATD
jgi:GT2 family glycosyltransferase